MYLTLTTNNAKRCVGFVAYRIYLVFCSFGLVKSYNMPCAMELASLELKNGNKCVTGGEDMWVRVFDFFTGEELGKFLCFKVLLK